MKNLWVIATLLVGGATAADTRGEYLRGSNEAFKNATRPALLSRVVVPNQAQITDDHIRQLLFQEELVKVVVKTKSKEKREKCKKKGSKIRSESERIQKVAMEVTPQVLQELTPKCS